MGIETLALGGLIGATGLAGSAMNAGAVSEANETNRRLQEEANRLNEGLTRESWAREDNAVQRRRLDLQAAGINPNLAAGSPAQTSGAAQMGASKSEAPKWGDMLSGIGQSALSTIQAQNALAQRDLTKATTKTEVEKPSATRAAASRDMSAAAKNYADAGYKREATRIVNKDADLWVKENIDVRDRDAVSKLVKRFPEAATRVTDFIDNPPQSFDEYVKRYQDAYKPKKGKGGNK